MESIEAKREHEINCLVRSLIKELKIAPSLLQGENTLRYRILSRFYKLKSFARFLYTHRDKTDFDFIEDLLEEVDLTYTISNKEKQHIPDQGRLVVVANHPLGGLESLVIAKAISEVRSDILIVSDDPIMRILNLRALTSTSTDAIEIEIEIKEALNQEKAVVIFPTRRISIRNEVKWKKSFLEYAMQYQADILPVFVEGRNSNSYNFLRYLKPSLNRDLLIRELFNKGGQTIALKIGNPIESDAFKNLKTKVAIKLLRKHTQAIANDKKGYFKTKKNVIHRVDRQKLRADIFTGEPLGYTEDEKIILLVDYDEAPAVMKEIARLRESTFRMVGEGTGQKKDIDDYDQYYKHLVLWDDRAMEVVGAYRLGIGKDIVAQFGLQGFYSNSLFSYGEELEPLLGDAIECGRSFVQPKYWNSMALDYLWHGIGAYIAKNPQIKYLFGPVSLSQAIAKEAKDMLIYFYLKWFGARENLAKAKNPYRLTEQTRKKLDEIFIGQEYKSDFKLLKQNLKHFGLSVPTLYKQYSELCEAQGMHFLDFGIDADFANCVDGLIIVEIGKIKQKKRARYIDSKIGSQDKAPNLASYFA